MVKKKKKKHLFMSSVFHKNETPAVTDPIICDNGQVIPRWDFPGTERTM